MNRELITSSEDRTMEAGIELARCLRPGDCVALDGVLGAGKTCLARGIAAGLGVESNAVSSPTFALLHEHQCVHQAGESGVAGRLYHLDAYRLEGLEELESIGWQELLDDPGGIMIIEWASRIDKALPSTCIRIDLEYRSESERVLVMQLPGQLEERFGDAWRRGV